MFLTRYLGLIISLLFALFVGLSTGFAEKKSEKAVDKPAEKTIVNSISKKDMKLLKEVDEKYQKNHGIYLKLKKTIKLGMLGSTKESDGEVWLNQGQMRLEINKPDPSKIIAGSEYLWIESAPPAGFADEKIQVIKASLNSDRAKAQGLIQLLTKGGVLKYFKVSGVQKDKASTTYFLQPNNQSIEFKRAQLQVSNSDKVITELRYWDQMDNETDFKFSKSEFNKMIDPKLFAYQPPPNAEVLTY